tara:strand:+ start:876 stop:2636 length:1761 start_codon:yes stop_codon:yes gene_type:complete
MKLWEKINNVTGNATKARFLVDFINQGSKFIVASLPEKFLWTIATESEVDGFDLVTSGNPPFTGSAGSSTPYDKILAVYRYDGSTKTSVNDNAKTFTLDTAGVKKRICTEVADSDIHIFDESNSIKRPTKMFPKFYKLSGKIFIKPDPDYNSDTDATGSYVDADGYTVTVNSLKGDKGVIVYAAPPIIDENTDAWILAEYENIALNYAASMDCLRVGGTQLTNGLSSLSSFITNFPIEQISSIVKPSATFSSVEPSASLPDSTLFNSITLPSGLSVAISLPQDFTITEQISNIPDLANSQNLPTMIQPSAEALDFTQIDDAQAKAKALIDDYGAISGGDVSGEGDIQVNSQTIQSSQQWLIQEDPEMVEANLAVASQELQRANSQIQEESLKLKRLESNLQSNQSKFTSDLQKYQAETQEEQTRIQEQLQKHQADVAREVQEINSQISKYSTEVQKEGARIGADVSIVQAEIGKLQAKLGSQVQKYQTELASKQATLQKEVQQYQSDVQRYGAEIQQKSQEFQSKVASNQKYVTDASTKIQIAQQQYGLSGQYYQKAINELSAITGAVSAPQQQQQAQRREERKSS